MLGHFVFTGTFVLSILLAIRKEECDRRWLYQCLLGIAVKCIRLNLCIFLLTVIQQGEHLTTMLEFLLFQEWASKIIRLKVGLFPDCRYMPIRATTLDY